MFQILGQLDYYLEMGRLKSGGDFVGWGIDVEARQQGEEEEEERQEGEKRFQHFLVCVIVIRDIYNECKCE